MTAQSEDIGRVEPKLILQYGLDALPVPIVGFLVRDPRVQELAAQMPKRGFPFVVRQVERPIDGLAVIL